MDNMDEFYMNWIPEAEKTPHEITYTHWFYNGYNVKNRMDEAFGSPQWVDASRRDGRRPSGITDKELGIAYDSRYSTNNNSYRTTVLDKFASTRKLLTGTFLSHLASEVDGFFPIRGAGDKLSNAAAVVRGTMSEGGDEAYDASEAIKMCKLLFKFMDGSNPKMWTEEDVRVCSQYSEKFRRQFSVQDEGEYPSYFIRKVSAPPPL